MDKYLIKDINLFALIKNPSIMSDMITQILQQKIKDAKDCGVSGYQLSTETGLNVAILHRIAHGKNCSAATADVLLKHFGLVVVEADRVKR